MAWIVGILVVLGAAAAAWLAMRARRRRPAAEVYETAPEQTHVEPEAAPAPVMATNEPTGGLEPETPLTAGPEEVAPANASGSEAAPSQTVPAGAVPRGEARDALLKQMVDAPPSAENPFRSRKARLRRARLILQKLEHEQEQGAAEPFDWRTYKPSTSHPAPATPPRVTV